MSLKGTSVMTESLHGNEEPGVLCRDVGRSRSGQERSSGGCGGRMVVSQL